MKLKHAYSPSEKTGLECKDKTLTLQSEANDTDINVIMDRYLRTGQVPYAGMRIPTSGDFDQIADFRTCVELVQDAERAFLRLPAGLRAELGNDPGRFIAFAEDPKNLPVMRHWGLAPPEEPKAPAPTPSA